MVSLHLLFSHVSPFVSVAFSLSFYFVRMCGSCKARHVRSWIERRVQSPVFVGLWIVPWDPFRSVEAPFNPWNSFSIPWSP